MRYTVDDKACGQQRQHVGGRKRILYYFYFFG
jgi:hypothetical protein